MKMMLTALMLMAGDPAAELVSGLRAEAEAGREASTAGDYAAAALHFEAAREAATRLSLLGVLDRVARASPSFEAEDSRFVLAESATLQFEALARKRRSAETRFINPEGRVVVVRAFGEEDDMADFMFVADDPAMMEKANIERAEMADGPALKRRTADGSLSVLVMSKGDHALIEVTGASEADVMQVVDAMGDSPAPAE